MAIQIRARVMGIRLLSDGGYGVTLGPGPRMIWLRTEIPPRLGQQLQVLNASGEERQLNDRASLLVLERGEVSVLADPYPRRLVTPDWIYRVCAVMRRPLMPFQVEAAAWMAARLVGGQGAMLCDDPGLGKTIQVLSALVASASLPAIVVCPTSIRHGWIAELNHLKPKLRAVELEGYYGDIDEAHVLIMSYSVLQRRERQLRRIKARCIVFDEGHMLKEPTPSAGHRAAAGTRLAHSIGRAVILTGTPVVNRPKELWRLLHILDKQRWPSFASFDRRYCRPPKRSEIDTGESIVTKHATVKRIRELQVLTDPLILRRRRHEVLRDQLLPKRHLRLLIELEEIDQRSYQEAEKDVVRWLRATVGDERASSAARGQAIVKMNMLRRIAAVGKLRTAARRYLRAWLRSQDEPIAIFAHHRIVLQGLKQICKALGVSYSHITGQMVSTKRRDNIEQFQRGRTQIFIAPIMAAGVGINLYRASRMLCLERLWSPSVMEQMESRCHRIGQRKEVTITYMDAKGTIDEHICNVLRSKQRVIRRVVDDDRSQDKQLIELTVHEVIRDLLRGRADPAIQTF